jgi:hypothetical protein
MRDSSVMAAAVVTLGGSPLPLRSVCRRNHGSRPKPVLCIAFRANR